MATRIVAPGGAKRARQAAQDGAKSASTNTPELAIRYYPGSWIRYSGTRAQLETEGLVPCELQWPCRAATKQWRDGRHEFTLQRARQPGARNAPWAEGNYWDLTIWLSAGRRSPLELAIIEKEMAVRALRHANSSEGRRESEVRYAAVQRANADTAFQAFKSLAFALVPPQGGRSSGGRHGER